MYHRLLNKIMISRYSLEESVGRCPSGHDLVEEAQETLWVCDSCKDSRDRWDKACHCSACKWRVCGECSVDFVCTANLVTYLSCLTIREKVRLLIHAIKRKRFAYIRALIHNGSDMNYRVLARLAKAKLSRFKWSNSLVQTAMGGYFLRSSSDIFPGSNWSSLFFIWVSRSVA